MIDQSQTIESDFFVAGGTLRSGAASYVTRPADAELLAATMAGDFCYVLTPRQMGKSSLMVRTARHLQAAGVRTVILDLTSIGTEVTVEQWYLGLLSRINARLSRQFDLAGWWAERAHLGVVQRFTEYLRELLLQMEERVVIFIDEIDTTLSLDFRDDFFAAIRYFYNMRSDEPGLERLSIVLLGVATPADLIRDRTRTPFNIGHRIELLEFSRDDASVLASGLEAVYPVNGAAVFERIYEWTNGHPYLTQKLCLAATEDEACANSPERVDDLVHDLFLSESARRETNLQFIRDNIQGQPADEQRRIVSLYRDVWRGKRVIEDERSPAQNRLKLIGLVKGNSGALGVRNRVYRTVFDDQWISETLPVDWNRRIAIGALLAVLIMALGVGAFIWNNNRQTTERLIAEQTALFASGNPAIRLTSLAALYGGGVPETVAEADALYTGLSPDERLALFDSSSVAGLDGPLWTVAQALTARLDDNDDDSALLGHMAQSLKESPDGANNLLGNGIEQWLAARAHLQAGDLQNALNDYLDAESLLARSPSPALLYDIGVSYALLGEHENALDYLEKSTSTDSFQSATTLATLPQWRERVSTFLAGRPVLLGRGWSARSNYPSLAAVMPTPTPFVDGVLLASAAGSQIAFSSARDGNFELYLMNDDGSDLVRLTDDPATDVDPSWSPDGRMIAFTSDRDGDEEIFVINADGSGLRQLTSNDASDCCAGWSPDGRQVVFNSNWPDGDQDIYVINSDGSGLVNLTDFPGDDRNPAWSPDGLKIAFDARRDGQAEIYVMNADGTDPVRLTNLFSAERSPHWSPDGTSIVYDSNQADGESGTEGDHDIFVMRSDGEDQVKVLDNPGEDRYPVWSPNGQFIAFTSYATGEEMLYVVDRNGQNLQVLMIDAGGPDWRRLEALRVAPLTPTPSRTATRTPPATATATATPTAGVSSGLNVTRDTNLRVGPGVAYRALGIAAAGTTLEIIARDRGGDWFLVQAGNGPAWISADFVTLLVEADAVPVAATIPAPPATTTLTPTAAPAAPPTPVPTAAPPDDEPGPPPTNPPPTAPPTAPPTSTEPPPTSDPRATPTP